MNEWLKSEPQTNGVIERFFKTLKLECLWIENFRDVEQARDVVGRWMEAGLNYENSLSGVNVGSIHGHCKPCTKKWPTNGLHFHWAPIETDDEGRVDENPKDWPPDDPDWPER